MRHAHIGRLTCVLVALGALAACSDEDAPPTPAPPSLSIVATSPCNLTLLPVPTAEDVANGTVVTANVVVTGADPRNSGGLMTAGTEVEMFIAGDDEGGGGGEGGRFISSNEGTSDLIPMNGRQARDEIFCTSQGTLTLHARIAEYSPGGTEPIQEVRTLAHRGWPIRCVSKAAYEAQCGAPPADFGVDGDVMDMGVGDGGGSDADVGPDMMPIPPNWGIAYQRLADEDAVIGIRGSGSGRPDNVRLDFLVTEDGMPVGGVPVEFFLPDRAPPNVAIEAINNITRADGIASVRLIAGGTPGVVSVRARATYRDEMEEDRSQTITIRAGIPSLRGMSMLCANSVIPAFGTRISPTDWRFGQGEGVNCTVQLADRVNGRVDKSTQVFFLSEAGTVNQVATVPEDGTGLVTTTLFVGPPAPFDTAPLAYEVAAGFDGAYNPRDGLVRVVAVTRGEEAFTDLDGDNIYTDGVDLLETSQDLSDPFIDMNDDGEWQDGGEPCSDRDDECPREEFRDADNDGFWSAANGAWDGDTEIWVSTTVLWVGRIVDVLPAVIECSGGPCNTNGPLPNSNCPAGLSLYLDGGGRFSVTTRAIDSNGNCPDAQNDGKVSIAAEGASLTILGLATEDLQDPDCYDFSELSQYPVRPIAQDIQFFLEDRGQPQDPNADPRPPQAGTITITYDQPIVGGGRERVLQTFSFCR